MGVSPASLIFSGAWDALHTDLINAAGQRSDPGGGSGSAEPPRRVGPDQSGRRPLGTTCGSGRPARCFLPAVGLADVLLAAGKWLRDLGEDGQSPLKKSPFPGTRREQNWAVDVRRMRIQPTRPRALVSPRAGPPARGHGNRRGSLSERGWELGGASRGHLHRHQASRCPQRVAPGPACSADCSPSVPTTESRGLETWVSLDTCHDIRA